MRQSFLNFSPPNFGQEEIDEVVDTLRSDWITTGPKTRRFEEEFAGFVGSEAALAVSSGTDAMLVGLAALGLGPGDTVITTAMTFCSTVHVIEHLGARPVLVDVDPETLNIDPQAIEKAVTQLKAQSSKVKGIMPVHLYGHPCEMDRILDLARAVRPVYPRRRGPCVAGQIPGSGWWEPSGPDGLQLLRYQEPDHGRGRHAYGVQGASG